MAKFAHRAVAAACLGQLVVGCALFDRTPPPGETAGKIYVGSPRVSGRERLVNDRREQEEWLQRQLSEVDNAQFGINGAIDTRSLSMFAAGLQAKTGPDVDLRKAQQTNQLALAREQGESLLAAERARTAAVNQVATQLAKKEIDAKEAATQLSALGVSMGALSTAVTPPGAGASSPTFGGTVNGGFADSLKAFGALAPPSAASAVMTGATGSPIELFRDRLALREEIRNEINENALDETHDLNRHSLYRMTFDATLLPDNDTSAWALVEVEMVPPSPDSAKSLWAEYRNFKQHALNTALQQRVREMQPFVEGCLVKHPQAFGKFVDCIAQQAFYGSLRERIVLAANVPANLSMPKIESIAAIAQAARLTNQIFRDLGAFGIASNRPSKAGSSGGTSTPTPPRVQTPETQFADGLFRVVATAIADEFSDERYQCFFALKTDDNKAYPPATGLGVEAYAIRLVDPRGSPEPDDCKGVGGDGDIQTRFAARLAATFPIEPRVYAVTPKETVQRISDVSSRRTASEFLFGLSALAGAGDISAMVQSAKQNDVLLQALRRQPLVVGFTQRGALERIGEHPKAPPNTVQGGGVKSTTAKTPDGSADAAVDKKEKDRSRVSFGWVLGPTFALIGDGSKPAFRHTVRQQSLTATVSVPAWWRHVTLRVRTSWHRENDMLRSMRTEIAEAPTDYLVDLPFRPGSIEGAFGDAAHDRLPYVFSQQNQQIQIGQSAKLFIRGENIWRSTEVYLGAQRANRVRLMPDMGGLIAEFDVVQPIWGAASKPQASAVAINLVTSEGRAEVGQALLVAPAATSMAVVGVGRRFFGSQATTLSIDPPIRSYRSVELRVKSRTQASLDVKVADTTTGNLAISRDGVTAQVTPKLDDLKVAAGTPVDLLLWTSTDASIAPQATLIVANTIYYPAAANAQATVAWGNGSGLRGVKLTLPPNVRNGFQAASVGMVYVVPTITTKANETVVLPSLSCKVEAKEPGSLLSKDCLLKPVVPATTKQEIKDAVKAGDFTLTFKIDGDDAPEVAGELAGK